MELDINWLGVLLAAVAAFIGDGGAGFGTLAGLAAGAGWVAAALGINYLFERRSLALFAIKASHKILAFAAIGANFRCPAVGIL